MSVLLILAYKFSVIPEKIVFVLLFILEPDKLILKFRWKISKTLQEIFEKGKLVLLDNKTTKI